MYSYGEYLQIEENGIKLIVTVLNEDGNGEPVVQTVGKYPRIIFPNHFTVLKRMTQDEVRELYKLGGK